MRNFTDVDDKIINRANERGISSKELSEQFIDEFYTDMDALGIERPSHEPKATEYIAEIIALCQTLIGKGMAYESGGDVYYSVEKFANYLRLSKRNLEEMQAGARIAPGEQKRNPMDFALWKAAKPGEPSWESPWGAGRPGWHIECSAMSSSLLGDSFDIHGGGRDLIFPHHENEIAQSEGASGKPFAKYWLHNGFVNVNQEKMSKSLGNFFTIRDILKSYDAEVVRFFILTAQYRSPIDFSDQNLMEAQSGLSRFYEALEAAHKAVAGIAESQAESSEGAELEAKFREAMDDDFNTAQAIAHLFEGVRTLNRLITNQEVCQNRPIWSPKCVICTRTILRLGQEVLGLFESEAAVWLEKVKMAGLAQLNITAEEIEAQIQARLQARQEKDFAKSDEIRDALAARGIELLDSP